MALSACHTAGGFFEDELPGMVQAVAAESATAIATAPERRNGAIELPLLIWLPPDPAYFWTTVTITAVNLISAGLQ